jgi:hypothetical protein
MERSPVGRFFKGYSRLAVVGESSFDQVMKKRKLIKKEPWNTILLVILFPLMAFFLFTLLELLRVSG